MADELVVAYAGKQHIFMVGEQVCLFTDEQCTMLAHAAMLQTLAPMMPDQEDAIAKLGVVYQKVMHVAGLQSHLQVQGLLACVTELAKMAEKETEKQNEGASTETKSAEVQTAD